MNLYHPLTAGPFCMIPIPKCFRTMRSMIPGASAPGFRSQSSNFGGRISFMIFIEEAQMDITTSNWMCVNFNASFDFLLLFFKNSWKIHLKIIIICDSHNIFLVWISHPAIEWIENILFLATFPVILCIVFSGTYCVVCHNLCHINDNYIRNKC